MTLICEASLLSAEAWNRAKVCPDGMLLHAASRLRCASVQESCYQPASSDNPRPCPAKSKGRQGCECDTLACAEACRHATPRDAEARFVWYTGSNQPQSSPNRSTDAAQKDQKKDGELCYGYRSLPLLLADPTRRFHLPSQALSYAPKRCPHPPSRLTSSFCFASTDRQTLALSYQPLPMSLFPLHDLASASITHVQPYSGQEPILAYSNRCGILGPHLGQPV